MIFFTIVSETLISAILADIPADQRVVVAVRELVADHAQDEGRHHAYFSRLLEFTWPRLNKRQRAAIGPLLPEMILAFLEPDFVAIAGNLRACGLTAEQIDEVMTESYPPAQVTAGSGRPPPRRSGTSRAWACRRSRDRGGVRGAGLKL